MLGAALGLLNGRPEGAPALVRRLVLVFVVVGLAWAALLTGVVFALICAYLWLATTLASGLAAAAATAALGVTSGLLVFRLAAGGRAATQGPQEIAAAVATAAPVAMIQRYPLECAGAALLAGLVVSGSGATREALTRQLLAFVDRELGRL